MPDRFPVCLAETLRWEGGYSNDKYDPGGPTNYGIIQVEYNAFRDHHRLPRQSVRSITREEFTNIYRDNYWVPIRADELPPGIDLLGWDFSVNSGCGQAIKSAQRVLGLPIDGHLGAVTMTAIHQAAPQQFIRAYMNERRRFLRGLKTFWKFGKGWMDRCNGVEAAALAAVTNSPPIFHAAPEADGPLRDPDAQSAQIGKAPAQIPSPPVATEASLGLGGLGGLTAAAPGIVERSAPAGKFSLTAFLLAVLSEPLFWVAATALFGAVMAYLYRRKHLA
jgi:lysozyme family protein